VRVCIGAQGEVAGVVSSASDLALCSPSCIHGKEGVVDQYAKELLCVLEGRHCDCMFGQACSHRIVPYLRPPVQ
jgi:hypothetical protein